MGALIWILSAVATVIPMLKLLPHFGIQKSWAFLGIIPLGALALIWWMAARLQEREQG